MRNASLLIAVPLFASCSPLDASGPSSTKTDMPRVAAQAGPRGAFLALSDVNGAPVCGSDLAQTTFRFGVCLCGDTSVSGTLNVSSLDGESAASVGINGDYAHAGDAAIGGTLVVGGAMDGAGDTVVDHELRVGQAISHAGSVRVGTNASVGGDVVVSGEIVVGQSLRVPADAELIGVEAGTVARGEVLVPAPCDCGETSETYVDVVGLVDGARALNDNAAIDLDALFADATVGDLTLDVPAGRFFIEELTHAGNIHLHVTGAAALFIAGDVATSGDFTVSVDDGATFDLFVAGDVAAAGTLAFGEVGVPTNVRVYIDGEGGLALAGEQIVGGALYVPRGAVSFAGGLAVAGAVVAKELAFSGEAQVGFDAGLLLGGEGDCVPPEGVEVVEEVNDDGALVCATPSDCGNQACIDGACGACRTSDDCPSPLACGDGTCVNVSG